GEEARRLYADSVREEAIVLPLPDFPIAPDASSVRAFYSQGDGQSIADEYPRVKALLAIIRDRGPNALTEADHDELMSTYSEHFVMVEARAGRFIGAPSRTEEGSRGSNAPAMANDDLYHLLAVRQWRKEGDSTVLRRLAGTLINIAIDYAASLPDLGIKSSARSQLVHEFLVRFERVDFATASATTLVPTMLGSLLEIVHEHPELLTQDRRGQVLAGNVAGAVFEMVQGRDFARLTLTEQDTRIALGNDVFRAVLRGAATAAREHPELFLNASTPGKEDLLRSVTSVLLDALIDVTHGQPERAYGTRALDGIAQAALHAVSRHPELVSARTPFLTALVKTTAEDVAHLVAKSGSAALRPDTIAPEVVRLVLANSALHLDALIPAGANDPREHLILIAAKGVLGSIAAPPSPGARWRAEFGEEDALRITRAVIAEVVANPAWVTAKTGIQGTMLEVVVVELLTAIRANGTVRLSTSAAATMIETVLRAMGLQYSLQLTNATGRRFAPLVLEAVLASIFAPESAAAVAWVALRSDVSEALVATVFDVITTRVINNENFIEFARVLPTAVAIATATGAVDLLPFRHRIAEVFV
ncbi:MAG: hypothetical protein ACKVQU_02595, partial [Burkholderiales bacterium]